MLGFRGKRTVATPLPGTARLFYTLRFTKLRALVEEEGMRGSAKVIEQLNAALSAELTAIVQYMVQAEMCDNWGYHRMGALTKKRAMEEMHHAEGLIERIIFLDGTPEVTVGLKPQT